MPYYDDENKPLKYRTLTKEGCDTYSAVSTEPLCVNEGKGAPGARIQNSRGLDEGQVQSLCKEIKVPILYVEEALHLDFSPTVTVKAFLNPHPNSSGFSSAPVCSNSVITGSCLNLRFGPKSKGELDCNFCSFLRPSQQQKFQWNFPLVCKQDYVTYRL